MKNNLVEAEDKDGEGDPEELGREEMRPMPGVVKLTLQIDWFGSLSTAAKAE